MCADEPMKSPNTLDDITTQSAMKHTVPVAIAYFARVLVIAKRSGKVHSYLRQEETKPTCWLIYRPLLLFFYTFQHFHKC